MNTVYRYILCVICTVVLCGTVRIFLPHDEPSLMKLTTGLIVTVVALSPILSGDSIPIRTYFDDVLSDSEFAVRSGVSVARQASVEFIKEKSEAYVLNKASELGAHVSVNVALSDSDLPIPAQVTVCGPVSPYIKMKLGECIENELGVTGDEQIWIS